MASKPHIVIFPLMAQGHLIPFLALAKTLEQKTSYTITLVNTSLNIQSLQSSLPPISTIRLMALPFNGPDHGLPPHAENTDSLPLPLYPNFFKASQALQPSFEQLISDISQQDGSPPACIITDMFFGWTVEIARKLGIFHTVFIASGAYGTALYFSLWLHLPHLSAANSDEFSAPGFPESGLVHRSQVPFHLLAADGKDYWSCFHRREFSLCLSSDGFLFNTVEELEKTGLRYFSRETNRPVWAIGPVTTNRQNQQMKESVFTPNTFVFSWLDRQPPRSVLYICFGSQCTISPSQMMEVAIGLESSTHKFIWVVRPPFGFDLNGDFRAEWLPEGFEERITEKKQGILVRKWAPQIEILGHESTGAFLSHCGWNSVLESLRNGVVLIGWPLGGEQTFNSKLLVEEVGVCLEVARGCGGEVETGRVKEVVEMVMGETEKGKEMRRKALKVKEMMKEANRDDEEFRGSSVRALDDFISTLSECWRGR
ncbi:hypothetical protein AAC387_Pa12g2348 [Persea americana]